MRDLKFAFHRTVPVMFGYLFLGFAFGVLMAQAGYSALWCGLASIVIFAGSMQFLLVELLSSGAALGLAAVMTLLINSRHLFYGLSFIERFKKLGAVRHYATFALTDETYSVLCALPEELTTPRRVLLISLMDHLYWIAGSVLGGLAGAALPFDTTGLDFCMTAFFVIIFIEQWLSSKSHVPALTGLCSAVLFLALLGPDAFILPSLIVTVAALLAMRHFAPMGGEAA